MNGLQNQLARLDPGLVGSIPTRSRHRASILVLAAALLGAVHASALAAQQPLAGASQDSAQAAQDAQGPGRPSAGGAFELSVDGDLVYSKLDSGEFPDEEAMVAEIGSRL